MNGKRYFVSAMVVNALVLVIAACLCRQFMCKAQAGEANDSRIAAILGPGGKFGAVKEITLRAAETNRPAEIRDLETGRTVPEPALQDFKFNVRAVMACIHSNGLDISCFVWPGGAACVTYDMNVIAVERKCWETTREEDLVANPVLAPRTHSPRRLLVLGQNRPDTYLFRTGEGTLGMLRILGLSQDGKGVNIAYKLINPVKSVSAAGNSQHHA
jgi:hypothetical protein